MVPNQKEEETTPIYAKEIGKLLKQDIRTIRKFGGNTNMTGRAVEEAVADRLRQFLPTRIEVGSGLVCYGQHVSGQMDIVLFDRLNSPVFGTGSNRIYPREGVIAVIEVKSKLDGSALKKAFKQIKPIKRMKRPKEEGRPRPDCYVLGAGGTGIEKLAETYVELVDKQHRKEEWLLAPDVVISLAEGVLVPCGKDKRAALAPTPNARAGVLPCSKTALNPFSYLVRALWFSWRNSTNQYQALRFNSYFGPEELPWDHEPRYFAQEQPTARDYR